MTCASKKGKKVRKFSEGGWSTSVSFDAEDAKRRAEEWAKSHPKKAPVEAPAPAPVKEAPARPVLSAEREAMRGKSQAPPRLETITVSAKRQKGPSNEVAAKVASGLAPNKSYLMDDSEPIERASRTLRRGRYTSAKSKYAGGGKVRGDGCASKGKTKGRMC